MKVSLELIKCFSKPFRFCKIRRVKIALQKNIGGQIAILCKF